MSTSDRGPVQGAGRKRHPDTLTTAVLATTTLVLLVAGVVSVAVLSLWGTAPASSETEQAWQLSPAEATVRVVPATVVDVLDGDTAIYRLEGGATEKVRMIGIDAPEIRTRSDRYTAASKEHADKILRARSRVFLERGFNERDRHGQLLAYVWLEQPGDRPSASEVRDKMLNAKMLLDGYAREFPTVPGVSYANVRYAALLSAYVAEAQEEQRGFWDSSFADSSGTTEAWATKASSEATPVRTPYVGHSRTKKYHRSICESAEKMRDENRVPLGSREEAIDAGFVACTICSP